LNESHGGSGVSPSVCRSLTTILNSFSGHHRRFDSCGIPILHGVWMTWQAGAEGSM